MQSPVRSTGREGGAWLWVFAGASLVYLGMALWVVVHRISFPFELEFMEGAILRQVHQLASGLPLYTPPAMRYVALDYPPLYFWLAAASVRVLGESFAALRLTSVVFSVVSLYLIWDIARLEARAAAAGWLAVGLFSALFRAGGAWWDVARADSLQLALVLALVRVARAGGAAWARVAGLGALACLAVLAKQSALVAAIPVLIWLAVRNPREGIGAAVACTSLLAGVMAVLNVSSHGWAWYYIVTVPHFHSYQWPLFTRFVTADVVGRLWPMLALSAGAVLLHDSAAPSGSRSFLVAALGGLIAAAWVIRSTPGGYDNVLMPAHAAFAIGGAVGFARLGRGWPAWRSPAWVRTAAGVLLGAQLLMLRWNPREQVPSAADAAAGSKFVSGLPALGANVLVPTHPYLAQRAGLPAYAHIMPLMDVIREGHGPREQRLLAAVRDSLRAHEWDAIVLDTRDWLTDEALAAGYRPAAGVFRSPDVFWPVTGMRTRPEWLLLAPRAGP